MHLKESKRLARTPKQYDKSEEYAELGNRARKKRAGLWADKDPVAPWEFRRKSK